MSQAISGWEDLATTFRALSMLTGTHLLNSCPTLTDTLHHNKQGPIYWYSREGFFKISFSKHKLTKTGWPETTEMCSLTFSGLNGASRTVLFLNALVGALLYLLQRWLALGIAWFVALPLPSWPLGPHGSPALMSVSPPCGSYQDTYHWI